MHKSCVALRKARAEKTPRQLHKGKDEEAGEARRGHGSAVPLQRRGAFRGAAGGMHAPYFAGLPLQQSPGGMGLPCGHVFGWPRKVQMRWSSSGLMMCSNLHAWLCTSDSSIANVSLKSRSASR